MFNKRKYMKQWHQDHPEQGKQWLLNNPEYMKQYYIDNEGKIKQYRIDNIERRKGYQRQYRQTEAGKATTQRGNAQRRTIMNNIVNTLTVQEWEDILEQYNYRCAYCGIEFNCENLPTRDHIIPISKSGHNIKENVVSACQSCNSKKYNHVIVKVDD